MKDYRHLRAWGQLMKSYPYYVQGQLGQARKDDAPEDVIYKDNDGHWVRFSEVTSPGTIAAMKTILGEEER